MQKHAEGCGSLWKKQSQEFDSEMNRHRSNIKTALNQTATTLTRSKSSEWVVIPVFVDIVRLALKTRTDCLQR